MPIFFIPARGRKPLRAYSAVRPIPDFLYPREGTETPTQARRPQSGRDFLYPREGTETLSATCTAASRPDFLYPREGTETPVSATVIMAPQRIFFIPARGRKPDAVPAPARGPLGFSLSPRGDGNISRIISAEFISHDFLHPRKGPPFPTKIDIFAIHLFTNSA